MTRTLLAVWGIVPVIEDQGALFIGDLVECLDCDARARAVAHVDAPAIVSPARTLTEGEEPALAGEGDSHG